VDKVTVMVAASGAGWEARALEELATGGPGIVLLKRCVDLNDLLANAATGQAAVALVARDLPGLDADSVMLLQRAGLAVVMVAERDDQGPTAQEQTRRWGVQHLVLADSMAELNEAVLAAGAMADQTSVPVHTAPAAPAEEGGRGRLLAVWGPAGAPGRTTVAVGLAAEMAHRGHGTFLLDVDPYGGAVAQHLGVLDEASGVLAAVRTANAGQLDRERLSALGRQVSSGLRVLTGLPRADRWAEVRDRAFDRLLDQAGALEPYVVLDAGFSLEAGPGDPFAGAGPQRNQMTIAALERADEIIVVGSADPVGLARLARGLVDLLEVVPAGRLRVAVNRARASLGWGEREVRGMIEGFVTPASVHFLPDDRAAADRALVAGKSMVETGDSPLRRAVARLADSVLGEPPVPAARGRRFRRGR
jgi:MinD-like ATPase involved in chromosome partitioning or flagellar assembly